MTEVLYHTSIATPEEPICDFCSEKPVVAGYLQPDYIMAEYQLGPMPVVANSTGGWSACEECARMVDAGQKEKLAARSAERFYVRHPEMGGHVPSSMALGLVRSAHAGFWENWEPASPLCRKMTDPEELEEWAHRCRQEADAVNAENRAPSTAPGGEA